MDIFSDDDYRNTSRCSVNNFVREETSGVESEKTGDRWTAEVDLLSDLFKKYSNNICKNNRFL